MYLRPIDFVCHLRLIDFVYHLRLIDFVYHLRLIDFVYQEKTSMEGRARSIVSSVGCRV